MSSESGVTVINDRYQVLELLGSGGMGSVYRVMDLRRNQVVALKRVILVSAPLQAEEEVDRVALKQEFEILAGIDHPHIIRVYACGFDENDQPFYTMDYLDGESIVDFGRGKELEIKVEMLRQMFMALAYLHERGVLQRDLKPGNMLVEDGQVKLTDFGLAACEVKFSSAVTTLQGTAAYLAPELLMGKRPSKAADLYAAGVIAYEVLAERHPFDVHNMNGLILSVLHEEPDLEALPDDELLRRLAASLLAKDPGQRPREAEDVIEELGKWKRTYN